MGTISMHQGDQGTFLARSGWLRRTARGAARMAGAAWLRLLVWHERTQQRRALSQLDERLLRDIGISDGEARHEASKPFWRP